MGILHGTAALMLGAFLLVGCVLVAPRVTEEPVAFEHPEEILKGTGASEKYWALADRRVFAVMAFLNATGYDEEAANTRMSPLRIKVRDRLASRLAGHPDKLQEWRRYYNAHQRGSWQYANFALSFGSDYPFRRTRPTRELIYQDTAWDLRDLPDVLNDFWITADLGGLWEELRPEFAAELGRYQPARMAGEMEHLWHYLRMPRRDDWMVVHIPNPLQRHFTASANQFGEFFYSIDGPGSNGGGLNVHEYLHTFINDLAHRSYPSQARKLKRYFAAGKAAPISVTYPDPRTWVSECLVFALDHRLWARRVSSHQNDDEMRSRVESLSQSGLTLVAPLYTALANFEKSDLPFDRYLPVLLAELPEYQAPADGQPPGFTPLISTDCSPATAPDVGVRPAATPGRSVPAPGAVKARWSTAKI